MIRSRRVVELPECGALLSTHALVHPEYRVHLVIRRNVGSEDALLVRGFTRLGGAGRAVATVVLEGRARMRVAGEDRWLEPGALSLVADKGLVAMRQESPFRSLVAEWTPGAFGDRP